MMYLQAVDLNRLKSQAVCFSGEQSLNHGKKKKKEIIGQRQQVLIEVPVLMWVTKILVNAKNLTYPSSYLLQV